MAVIHLGGVVTAILLTQHQPVFIILPVVIVAGALAGALTGIIHTKLKINALLAGILVMTALYSVNLTLMGRSNIPLDNTSSIFTLINISADPNHNTFWILLVFVAVDYFDYRLFAQNRFWYRHAGHRQQ